MSSVPDPRAYPERPFLAVSAAIFRGGQVLLVRRARAMAHPVYTLPGGVVETGETLEQAVCREVMEECALTIEPGPLAGYREFIQHDTEQRVLRHFVIMAFAARWRAGEVALNGELAEAKWTDPAAVAGLSTTERLAEIVEAAAASLGLAPPA
jgi:8-oxo-dGTP diphosphatase